MKYFVEVFSGALVVLYHYIPSRLNSPLPRVQASISFESNYLFLFVFLFFMSVCKMYHSSSRASLEIIGGDLVVMLLAARLVTPREFWVIKIPKRAKSKHKGHLV